MRQWGRLELHGVDLGMGQAHRDLTRDISSHERRGCGGRLAHRQIVAASVGGFGVCRRGPEPAPLLSGRLPLAVGSAENRVLWGEG